MLATKIERFFAKRALIICSFVAILELTFFREHTIMLAGLAAGTVFSLLRLNSYVSTFSKLFSADGETNAVGKVVAKFIVNSFLVIISLTVSVLYDRYFFFGILSGIFTVPLVIILNSITEALGITNNKFE